MRRFLVALALTILAGIADARAQAYPSRPITLVVPFPPGGSTDAAARIMAERMRAPLGQPIVIENVGGAGGSIGVGRVARAAPDGYTFLMVASTLSLNSVLYKKVSYDPIKDFAPIMQVASAPNVLIVNPAVPAKSLTEFIALAKQKPGQLTYGTPGIGTSPHMCMELLKYMAGIDVQHIPYRGVSQSVTDILGGRVSGMVLNVLTAKPHIEAGQLRALGVTGLRRSEALPNVPTIAETAVPTYEALQWFGILAPAGTPAPIVALLQAKIAEGLRAPEIKARLAADGAEAVATTPAEFAALINDEIEKWTVVAKAANIQPED